MHTDAVKHMLACIEQMLRSLLLLAMCCRAYVAQQKYLSDV